MRFVLYRYKETSKGRAVQYVKEVKSRKLFFSTLVYDAKRSPFIKAIALSLRYRVSWIHEKHLRGNL
jgi:hypothetical protein